MLLDDGDFVYVVPFNTEEVEDGAAAANTQLRDCGFHEQNQPLFSICA